MSKLWKKQEKVLPEWLDILDKFKASEKKSNEVVSYLQNNYDVARYWARTLTTLYLKKKE